jgi:uncharacterized phage protein (TIGR02218 family)
MKTITPQLQALFEGSSQFGKCDLFTITLSDGTVIRTNNADVDLTWGGNTFLSCKPAIERTKVRLNIGIEVDTMTLTLFATADTVNGFTYNHAARIGLFDGATVLVETAYIQTWPTIVGVLHTFFGLISEVEPGRSEIVVTVKSALELLSQQFPRNVYQPTCLHTVYNSGCGLSKALFTSTGTVTGGASATGISSGLSQAADYFDQGVLTFTSGPLSGIKRTVKSYSGGAFTFANPLASVPSVGTTFSVFAGCDKTRLTCQSKFNNIGRFRGFPFIPTPETTF